MTDFAEEQLNRLITAYNSKENPEIQELMASDFMGNESQEIQEFENKFKKTKSSKLQKAPKQINIEFQKRKSLVADYKIPNMRNNYQESEPVETETEMSEKPHLSLQEQINQLKFEDELCNNEHLEFGLSEACVSNKNLIVQIKNERNQQTEMMKQTVASNQIIATLHLKLELKSAQNSENREKTVQAKEGLSKTEEKLTSQTLKLNILENSLGKIAKVLRREIPEIDCFDVSLKPDLIWKGRFEQMEILKSKLENLKIEKEPTASSGDTAETNGSVGKLVNKTVSDEF